nr:MAG TPA: hypothetical protein [Caudoviricetes sp.]
MTPVTACVANSNSVRVVAIPASGSICPIVITAIPRILVLSLCDNADIVVMSTISA